MVVNYSKWDALELSDDSDIECHQNVEKKSFIRAKQNQIHQQRHERRLEIETLKYERVINDGLLERINALLDALKKYQDSSKNPDELVFQALIESTGDPAKDDPPRPPPGVHTAQKEPMPKFSKMMGSLVDQVKGDVDNKEGNRYQAFIDGVHGHLTKVQNLQQELLTKLASLEKEESSKITSDSIRTGFNSSRISKRHEKPKSSSTAPAEKKVELLNPTDSSNSTLLQQQKAGVQDDGPVTATGAKEADKDDLADDSDIQPTPLGKNFAKLEVGDNKGSLDFISQHPEIVSERETDGLLVEAFNAQMDSKEKYAHQCVHQALLLQYCGKLGRDGVSLFFKRISTKDHQARKLFVDDVNTTYRRIQTRTAELQKEKSAEDAAGGVEQIQLHAVDPNSKIHIVVPDPNSSDPTEIASRQVFNSFPPNLQKALAAADLDKVNDVLGKMAVSDAEEVVQQLGEAGMLGLEEGVLDATTEEGQQKLKLIEEEGRDRSAAAAAAAAEGAEGEAEVVDQSETAGQAKIGGESGDQGGGEKKPKVPDPE